MQTDPRSTRLQEARADVPRAGSVHVAGAAVGLEQRCSRCGILLVDYRETSVMTGAARLNEARPIFFTEGRAVLDTGSGFVTHNLAESSTSPATRFDPLCRIAPKGTRGVI